jgi:hypothetical protein
MPGRDPLNSIADIAALQAEADRVIAIIKDVDAAVKNVGQVTTLYKGSSGSAELKKNTEELAKANQDLLNIQKQLDEEAKKRVTLEDQLAKAIAAKKIAAKQMTDDELRDSVKSKQLAKERLDGIKAEESAYKQLSLEKEKAAAKAKDLAAQSLKNPTDNVLKGQADAAAKEANDLNNKLKIIDGSMGEHRRKVGDYIGALNTLTPVLNEIKNKMDQMTGAGMANGSEFENLKQEYEAISAIVSQNAAGFTSLTMQIRNGEKALQTMRAAGLEETDAFKQLRLSVASAHREFNEFQNAQKILENHAPTVKALTIAAKGMAGAYALSAGAVALFGDEEGKIEKETQKLIAVMTILQGLNEVSELLHQRNAVAIALETTASKIAAAAQRVWASTMLQSTLATIGFRTALITLTGGLLLLLPLAAMAFSKIAEAEENARIGQEALNEVNKKSIEGYATEVSHIQFVVKELKDENLTRKDKKNLIDDMQHQYPEILGNIKNEGELTSDLADAINLKLIPALRAQAMATAARELAGEKFKKVLEIQNNAIEEGAGLWEKFKIGFGATGGGTDVMISGIADAAKNSEKEVGKLNKQIDALFGIALKSEDEVKKLGGGVTDHVMKEEFTDITKLIEARTKLIELIKQQRVEELKAFSGAGTENSRIKALQSSYEIEKQIIEDRKKTTLLLSELESKKAAHDLSEQLKNTKLIESEKQALRSQAAVNEQAAQDQRKAIVIQSENELFRLQVTRNIELGKIRKDSIDQLTEDYRLSVEEIEAIDQRHSKRVDDMISEQFNKRKAFLSEDRDINLKALEQKYASGGFKPTIDKTGRLISAEEQYQKERQRLEDEADVYILKAQEDMIRQQIAIKKAAGQDTVLLENQISSIELDIERKKDKAKIDSNKKAFDEHRRLEDLKKELAEKAYETAIAFIGAGSQKNLNAIQEQIDASTKLKDQELARVNSSTLSEQDKAARIAQINAAAQIKQDQLEQKRRQEQTRQAKFDRDAQALKIFGETLYQASKAGWITPEAIIIEAIGALEIAALLAKPIPKYADGSDYAQKGLMIWGERGKELMITPSGKVSASPDTATIGYVPETGSKIIPHDEVNKALLAMMMQNTVTVLPQKKDEAATEIKSLKQVIKWQHDELIRAYGKIKYPTIIIQDKNFGKDYIP